MTTAPSDPPPDAPPNQNPIHNRHWTDFLAWAFLAAAILFALTQCAVLVKRVEQGRTDFSVILRTAQAINRGENGDLYSRPANPKWPRSIPPIGTAAFQFLALMPPRSAAIVWAATTLALLAAAGACLAKAVKTLGPHATDYQHALPWALAVLVLLAADCLQTGQFSILFVACWLAFIPAAIHQRNARSAALLALPAAVKFYPALLLAVPLALRRKSKKFLLTFTLAWLALTAVVPLCILGPAQAWDLSSGYVRHNFLAPANVVNLRFHAATVSNQAIDVVMLRYLTDDPEFHHTVAKTTSLTIPHLNLSRPTVLALAQAVRLAILALAVLATWRYARTPAQSTPHAVILLTALWAATLYLVLPETKARYAVYTAPAYLPILAAAARAASRRATAHLAAWLALILASLIPLIALPRPLLHLGLGVTGPVILFAATLWLVGEHRVHGQTPDIFTRD